MATEWTKQGSTANVENEIWTPRSLTIAFRPVDTPLGSSPDLYPDLTPLTGVPLIADTNPWTRRV